jgi:genome maintenance exonuclease 1
MFTVKRTKEFLHSFVTVPAIERVEIDGVRHYRTPEGDFRSVTSILGERLDKTGLIEWKERVGEEEANKISTQAANRGTAIHALAEAYLLNNKDWKRGAMPVNLDTFSKIRPILDLNIGSVYGIEIPLYSAKLKTAGTCDFLGGYGGINSVVDFKTSRRIKDESHILSYFLQATAYSLMAEELTDLKFPQIVVIIAVDHEEPEVFIKKRDEYVDTVFRVFA